MLCNAHQLTVCLQDSVLSTDDYGKDLASVQTLQRKHEGVERDLDALEDRVRTINQEAKFFRDIADEESWIKEKKLLVTSDDYGRDLTGVQNLRKKHKRFESELGSHEPAIKAVQEAGGQLIASSTLGGAEIEQRLQQLAEVWAELKGMAASRGQKLEESITYQQFLAKIEEEEAWISEKQQLLTVPDLGDNMAAVQGLLKKHDAFETDISVHGDRCTDICEAGQQLIDDRNHHADSIAQRCEQLRNKVK